MVETFVPKFHQIYILIPAVFLLLFLIPSAKAGITLQERYWERVCSHFNVTGLGDCDDNLFHSITDYLTVTYEEHGVTWHFTATNNTPLPANYSLEDLKSLPVINKDEAMIISAKHYNPAKNTLNWVVVFPNGWESGKQFSIGTGTITMNSGNTMVKAVATTTAGTAASPYTMNSLYTADKKGNVTLLANSSGIGLKPTQKLRPANNYTIPVNISAQNLTDAGAGVWWANITGFNASGHITSENFTFISNYTNYTSVTYWKNITSIDTLSGMNVSIWQNQWGCFWKQGMNDFASDCRLQLGNGTYPTFFNDTYLKLSFNPGVMPSNNRYTPHINITVNSTFTCGRLVSYIRKSTDRGCYIEDLETASNAYNTLVSVDGAPSPKNFGSINLYSTTLSSKANLDRSLLKFGDMFNSQYITYAGSLQPNNMTMYNVYIVAPFEGLKLPKNNTMNEIKVYESKANLPTSVAGNADFTNSDFQNSQLNLDSRHCGSGYLTTCDYFTDSTNNNWANLNWYLTSAGSTTRRNTLNILIIDKDNVPIDGVNVTLWNSNNSQMVFATQTNVNGTIPSQLVNTYWIMQANGTFWNDYNPFVIKVNKTGYETLNFTANITEKTKWTLYLYKTTDIVFMSYDAAVIIGSGMVSFLFAYLGLNMKGEKFGQPLKLIFIGVSMFLAANTLALASNIASSNSASTNVINLINTGMTSTTYTIYVFLALVSLGFLIGIIYYFGNIAKKRK